MSLCTVGPSQQYPTLFAAEADNFGLGTTVLPDALVVECFPMEDTAACTISGFTTTATNRIEIRTAFGYEHSGVWSDSVYRMKAVTATSLTAGQSDVRAIGLQFDVCPVTSSYIRGWVANSYRNLAVNCIARGTGCGSGAQYAAGFRMAYASTTCAVVGCISYDFRYALQYGVTLSSAGSAAYNSTVYNCTIGFSLAGSTCVIKNCIAMECGDGYVGTCAAASTNNTSDIDSDALGSNATTGGVQFVNAGAFDFHLADVDTVARGTGGDLTSDYNTLGISLYDIDLQAITVWSRGADVQAGAASSGVTISMDTAWAMQKTDGAESAWSCQSVTGIDAAWAIQKIDDSDAAWAIQKTTSTDAAWAFVTPQTVTMDSAWDIDSPIEPARTPVPAGLERNKNSLFSTTERAEDGNVYDRRDN